MLAMLTKLLRHISSLTITLRYFQDNLSGSGVDELLHLVITLLNSSAKKGFQVIVCLVGISFNKSGLI